VQGRVVYDGVVGSDAAGHVDDGAVRPVLARHVKNGQFIVIPRTLTSHQRRGGLGEWVDTHPDKKSDSKIDQILAYPIPDAI
jgi:hypothetical protein